MAKTLTLNLPDEAFTRVTDAFWNDPNNIGPGDDIREGFAEDVENPTVEEKGAYAKRKIAQLLKRYVVRVEMDIQRRSLTRPTEVDIS